MATITLRVEDQVKDDLEALARSRGTTVTDLLRPLIEEAAGRPAGESHGVHPAHLTAVERRTMSLLHQILGRLDPEDESYHRLRAQALDEGYTAEYGDEFLGIAGFDANDPLEGRLLYYARHLLATDRWTDLADYFDDTHDGGNSHRQA